MKKINLLVAILFFTLSIHAQDLKSKLPVDDKIRTGTLSNGMRYYIRHNSKPENRAELRIAVNAGSTSENDDQQGFAHLVEHMAFNGTEHFKKSELVDYLESIGTKFGAHLNAYTSFDETVYMLQLPTDNPTAMEKGLQILDDWSHALAFDSVEIEKERGVVIEEWRLGQGANERMRRKYWPLLFKDSRYALRLPIGKKEIIEKGKQSALKQFYKDWYRPDLMAVIAVGDFDVAKMEDMIKKQFEDVKLPEQRRTLMGYVVPDNDSLIIATATDKEARRAVVELIYKQQKEKEITVEDYMNSIAKSLFTSMLNQRLDEMSRLADPPFLNAGADYGPLVRAIDAYSTSASAREDAIERTLVALTTENERVRRFGFTQAELDRQKTELLRGMEIAYNERDKTESRNFAREYISNFLTGEPIPGIEFEYNTIKKFIGGISLEQINGYASKWITDGKNCIVLITAPDKETTKMPSDAKIKEIVTSMKSLKLEPYSDKFVDKPLLPVDPTGSEPNYDKQIKELNITEWRFPNGVRVMVKPTDFKNDEILFTSYSWGGWSQSGLSNFRSAASADDIIDESGISDFDVNTLIKKLSGKSVSCSPYISELIDGLSGNCAPSDLETLMQLIYAYNMYPRKDSIAFESWMIKQKTALQNRSGDPQSVFGDTISYVMSGYNARYKPMTVETLKEIKLDEAYNFYESRFGNKDFSNYFFVGNLNIDTLKKLATKYLGSLPMTRTAGKWADIGAAPPKGIVERTVNMGQEPKSTVMLRYNMPFDYNRNNRNELNALAKLMNIRLREVLREEMSGVYGVSFSSAPQHYPEPRLEQIIYFSCDPQNVNKLIQAAKDVIKEVKEKGSDEKNLVKIKETAIRERETYLKENNFWLSTISSNHQNGEDILDILKYNDWVNSLKGEDFKGFAKKYIQEDNFATFTLMPKQ
jgi:zinc protease